MLAASPASGQILFPRGYGGEHALTFTGGTAGGSYELRVVHPSRGGAVDSGDVYLDVTFPDHTRLEIDAQVVAPDVFDDVYTTVATSGAVDLVAAVYDSSTDTQVSSPLSFYVGYDPSPQFVNATFDDNQRWTADVEVLQSTTTTLSFPWKAFHGGTKTWRLGNPGPGDQSIYCDIGTTRVATLPDAGEHSDHATLNSAGTTTVGTSGNVSIDYVAPAWTNGGTNVYTVRIHTRQDPYSIGHEGGSIGCNGTALDVRVTVLESDNSAREFRETSTMRSIPENSAANADVGAAITATDTDNDPLTYTLEGADVMSFSIVEGTGQLRTRSGISYDHEQRSSYSVTVRVQDDEGASDTIDVTIEVTDVAEAPDATGTPQVSGASTSTISAIWSPPADNAGRPPITGYDVQHRRGATGAWTNGRQNHPTTSVTIADLREDTPYQVRVRAKNHEDDGPWSQPGSGRTLANVDMEVNDPATGAPGISGRAYVGRTLTASTGGIRDADGLTRADRGDADFAYTWQWIRVDADGESNPADIAGATERTYTLQSGDVGKKLKVRVGFIDDRDNAEGPLESAAYPPGTTVTARPPPPPNRAPTATDATVATVEDTAYAFTADDFAFSDPDRGDVLVRVRVVMLPELGGLTLGGAAVTAGARVARADLDAGKLVWTPPADANGVGFSHFTFRVSDGTAQSADAYTMTLDVTAVNDAPTSQDTTVTTSEDVPYTFRADDFLFTDVENDALASVTVVRLPDAGTFTLGGTAVTLNQAVTRAALDTATLAWTPPADTSGTGVASFDFRVSDGTAQSADAYTMTLDVTAVNDAPTSQDTTVTTSEDVPYTFRAGDFPFADVENDALASVTVVRLPDAGTFTLGGAAVTLNQAVTRAALDTATLAWTPPADTSGTGVASFDFRVSDGTAQSADAYTMTLDVTAVNDAPTSQDTTVTTSEDVPYTFRAGDFPFADVENDALASVTVVRLPDAGTFTLGGTAVTLNQAVTRAALDTATLAWTPPADTSGTGVASFDFRVSDGTAQSADAYTMTLDVTAVNDAPTSQDTTVTTSEDVPYTFRAGDFPFADVENDALASVTVVRLPDAGTFTLGGTAVTLNQAVTRAALDTATLAWTPPADTSGTGVASFDFRVSDGTAQSADAYTMTLDVTAVNDAPTSQDTTVTTSEDVPYTFRAGDFPFADVENDALASVTVVRLPDAGTFTLGGAAVTLNQAVTRAALDTATLAWTPPADTSGTGVASFDFRVSDGTAQSADAYTMTLDVTAVNDAPTSQDTTVTTSEDVPYTFRAGDFPFADVENDALASVTVVRLPDAGTFTLGGTAVTADKVVTRADLDAGALTWTPPANAHGAGYSSFTFRVSDGEAQSAAAYTMTLDVEAVADALAPGWLARFGRTVAGQVVEAVGTRLESGAGGGSHVQVGGVALGGTGEWVEEMHDGSVRPLEESQWLGGSAFRLSGGVDGGWTAWGRLAGGGFDARGEEGAMDARVRSALLGADVVRGRWLGGVAVSVSEGEGGYGGGGSQGGGGEVSARMGAVYPYAQVGVSERVSAWGLAGYGAGELRPQLRGGEAVRTDVAMELGAVGVRGDVYGGGGAVAVAAKSDALWLRMRSEAVGESFEEVHEGVTRLRLLLEGSGELDLGGGGRVRPSLELGVRHEGGDAETGTGIELGAGVRYARRGVTVQGAVRTLVAHESSGYEEWGVSGAVRIDPGAAGRGLSLRVHPAWGAVGGGVERLWSVDDAGRVVRGEGDEVGGRVEAEMGYGVGLGGSAGVLTPYAGLRLDGGGGARTWRGGARWRLAPGAMLAVEATRRAAGEEAGAGHEVMLRGSVRW